MYLFQYHNIEPRETITLATWVKDRASLEFVSILDWVGFENEQQVQFDFEFCGYHAELPNMVSKTIVETRVVQSKFVRILRFYLENSVLHLHFYYFFHIIITISEHRTSC